MKLNELLSIDLHQQLNPKIWRDDQKIQPAVQAALLRIAREFYDFLGFRVPLKDIQITGSQANYAYSEYSDIDLHLIVDFRDVECDQPVDLMFDSQRKLWKERHTITIHDIPVEVYVEDTGKPVKGSTYSLLSDQWIDRPKPAPRDIDEPAILAHTQQWAEEIQQAMATKDLAQLEAVRHRLKLYRQAGLDREGEFGVDNLVFKNLRNLGVVGLLVKAIDHLEDQALSI